MGKIGNYEYPDVKFSDAIDLIKVFKDKLGGEASTIGVLATAWGHQTANSGAFLKKLSDVRKYGLIEGRGEGLKLSDSAQKILLYENENERDEAIRSCVFRVSLWKDIHQKLNGKGVSNDFYILLKNLTGIDRLKAEKEAGIISKLYIDAVSKIRVGADMNAPHVPSGSRDSTKMSIAEEGIVNFNVGKINLSLPENVTSLELIKMAIENRIKELGKKDKDKKKEGDVIDA